MELNHETVQVSSEYRPDNKKWVNTVIDNMNRFHTEIAENQKQIIERVKPSTLKEVSGAYSEFITEVLEEKYSGELINNEYTDNLRGIFSNETVRGLKFGEEIIYIVHRPASRESEANVSGRIIILTNPDNKSQEDRILYTPKHYIHYTDQSTAIDLIDIAKESNRRIDIVTPISNDRADETSGVCNPEGIMLMVQGQKSSDELSSALLHEIGHSFQGYPKIEGDIYNGFLEAYLAILKKAHLITQDFYNQSMKKGRFQEVVYRNIIERNADAFWLAIERKSESFGIIITSKENKLTIRDRRIEERKNNYGPERIELKL